MQAHTSDYSARSPGGPTAHTRKAQTQPGPFRLQAAARRRPLCPRAAALLPASLGRPGFSVGTGREKGGGGGGLLLSSLHGGAIRYLLSHLFRARVKRRSRAQLPPGRECFLGSRRPTSASSWRSWPFDGMVATGSD